MKLLVTAILAGLLVACTLVPTDQRVIRLPTQEYREPVTYQVKDKEAWFEINGRRYTCEVDDGRN